MRRMFSEKQLENIVDEHLAESDVVVNTLTQKQASWSIDLKSLLNASVFKDTSKLYCQMCLLGNELQFVISGIFTSNGTSGNATIISNKSIDIPDEIAAKIFRADGTSLLESPLADTYPDHYITGGSYVKEVGSFNGNYFTLFSSGAKKISLIGFSIGTSSEDAKCWIDIRTQLVIL